MDIEDLIPVEDVVITLTERGYVKRQSADVYKTQRRGGRGVIAMNLTEKTGRLVCMRMVQGDEDVMMIRDDGTVMRMPVEQIRVISRNTQGVKLMQVPEGARVASVALVAPESSDSPQEDPAD